MSLQGKGSGLDAALAGRDVPEGITLAADVGRVAGTSISLLDVLGPEYPGRPTQTSVIRSLAHIGERRCRETRDHVARVGQLAFQIASELARHGVFADRLDRSFLQRIAHAAALHDAGKLLIPLYILHKAGELTPRERSIMEQHSRVGGAILRDAAHRVSRNRTLLMAADIAEFHHERFDGAGYPEKRAGELIPLCARITSVADVFDALTRPRPYKHPWPLKVAIDHIAAEAGRAFDPLVVGAFLRVASQFQKCRG